MPYLILFLTLGSLDVSIPGTHVSFDSSFILYSQEGECYHFGENERMVQTKFCAISFKVCLRDNCQQNYHFHKIAFKICTAR